MNTISRIRLFGYLKNNPGGYTIKVLAEKFETTGSTMYHKLRSLLSDKSIARVKFGPTFYYGYRTDIPFMWVEFSSITFDGKVYEPKPKIQVEDFYRILDPTYKRTKITLLHRIKWKINNFRIWLADLIYPHER